MNEMQTEYCLPKGTLLFNGKYRIEAYLASGGFGNTYLATDTSFNEQVAIKELFVKGICGRHASTGEVSVSLSENRISFEAHREKFRKEARRIRKLNSPHETARRGEQRGEAFSLHAKGKAVSAFAQCFPDSSGIGPGGRRLLGLRPLYQWGGIFRYRNCSRADEKGEGYADNRL